MYQKTSTDTDVRGKNHGLQPIPNKPPKFFIDTRYQGLHISSLQVNIITVS